MAVAATGVVIYDPLNGSNDNAGYFDASLASAGTDYPRAQAAAILTATDLACTTGGTTLTSATGGFTEAMIGNGIYIKSGTNFTAGLYVITARADTNTVTLDRDPTNGSNASSGAGAVGGRRAVLLDAWLESPYVAAGMRIEIWATATMTLTEDLYITLSGTSELPIVIDGRASDGSAYPQGDNRPVIAGGGFTPFFNDFWNLQNIIYSSSAHGWRIDEGAVVSNCKMTNTYGSPGRYGLKMDNVGCRVVDTELVCTNGIALDMDGAGQHVYACYVHDSATGMEMGAYSSVVANIIEACTAVGIQLNSNLFLSIINNTIDTCVDGVSVGSGTQNLFLNNILSNHTSEGAVASGAYLSNYWDYNNFYANGTDRKNVAAGPNDNAVDPGYTNAAAGDFSTGANVADTGFGIRLGVG